MKSIGRHVFCLNPHANGGESLLLTTEYFHNGEPDGICATQELSLHSYCNSAVFSLRDTLLDPEKLRKLADELEAYEKSLKEKV